MAPEVEEKLKVARSGGTAAGAQGQK